MKHETLRALARDYYEIAMGEENQQRAALHRAVNDLHMVRPVLLIDELPLYEMNVDNELTMTETDPVLREAEWFLRVRLYLRRHFASDLVLKPFLPVGKVVRNTGVGIGVEENTLATDARNHIISHDYHDQLATDADLEKLQTPHISYDKTETLRKYQLLGDVLGDIIPIRITGIGYFGVTTWDDIARYRGVENLLVDLADRPDFTHRLVDRLTAIKESELAQYEALGLFDTEGETLHCTPILTSDLPSQEYDGTQVTRKDIWGRGAAQIFASVSRDMHDEFDIQYMKRTIGTCGLSYYGCCEPLDRKIDLVAQIPNLRKISVTPWADVNIAAEAIGKKYVLSAKPNPAALASSTLDRDFVRREITGILDACKRYGCACDIVLKDVSSCAGHPENVFEWSRIAKELVENYD